MLNYRTLGNSTPEAKPKVFFTCHPDDFELYFEAVSDDILNIENCAIWYEDAKSGNDSFANTSDLDLTVGTMQLVVIAVTKRLLTESNVARDVILPYARNHGIPVLPITEASDELAMEFNKISGGVQMLDRLYVDETAISYEEKLEKYLKSVLISDSLAALVRDAFDAYVFLSYRKKDRAYDNELMSRIHENRQYRDIAIWFDEYLVPGEKFTKGIEEALAKSPIFAMAVTPNLLEPGNYVMAHEYKDAKAADKIIVPVEMTATDHKAMHANYDGLPSIQTIGTDSSSKQAFHDRFIEALNRAAITANDDTPEHNFYIGLAYLAGIDVEVNRERAVDMISGSSEHGCAPATQKLVYMYRNGEGVERNSEKELEYQYKLVEQRKAAYDEHPDIDLQLGTTTKYFKSLVELSDMLRERGRSNESVETAETALSLYEELVTEVGIREAGRDRALICNRLGGIAREQKKLKEAREYYTEALRIYESMSDEITTRRARRDLSISYEKLGNVERASKCPEAALAAYMKAEAIRKELADENPTTGARRDYSVICTKLGSAYKELGKADEAIAECEKAVKLDEQLEAELGAITAKRDLSISAEKLGRLYYKKGMVDAAKPLFEKTAMLREEIYKTTGKDKHKEELDYAYHNLEKVR